MQRNRQRIAEPKGAREQKRGMASEEEDRDIGAARCLENEDGKEAKQRREPDRRAPLAGRNPHLVRGEQQDDDGEPRGIEDVLAIEPEDEFRADGDHGRDEVQPGHIRPEQ